MKQTKQEATIYFPASWWYSDAYFWLFERAFEFRGDQWAYGERWVYRINL